MSTFLSETSSVQVSPPNDIPLENQSRPNKRLILRVILALGLCIAIVAVLSPDWKRVLNWGLADNDDAMRVLQVHDWLMGQRWFDTSQHRLAPVPGGNMHWSRLADLPLAAFMWPLMAIFGPERGAQYAAFITPLAIYGILIWIAIQAAKALGGRLAMFIAMPMVASAPSVASYFAPGRVDHHGIQIILIVCGIWGLFLSTARSHFWTGLALAAGICIGLEALPLQICLIGWVALRWGLRGSEVQAETRSFGLGFALGLVSLFGLTVPFENWNLPVNDAIGRGYVVLGALGGLLLSASAHWLNGQNQVRRFLGLCVIGGTLALGLLAFPEVLSPPYKNVHPLLTELWLSNVTEATPLYKKKLDIFISLALFPVFTVLAAIYAVFRAPKDKREMVLFAAFTTFVAMVLALFWQVRIAGLATSVAAIVAAGIIAQAVSREHWRSAVILTVLVNPLIPAMFGLAIQKFDKPNSSSYEVGGGTNCSTTTSIATLAAQPKGLTIAPIDMGARILLTTQHSVIAAPYHRNNAGNLASYQTFLAPQAVAKDRAKKMGAQYLAICEKSAEVGILSEKNPKGLMADLKRGKIPDWLAPLPKPKGSHVRVYKIKD